MLKNSLKFIFVIIFTAQLLWSFSFVVQAADIKFNPQVTIDGDFQHKK
jgi:hypothetical protein